MLESNPSTKAMRIRKPPPTRKTTHPNVDDTDTEDDSDTCEAAVSPSNAGTDEWKTFLNTIEDIPDGMSVVRWWGVCYSFWILFACFTNTDSFPVVEWFPIPDLALTRRQLSRRNGFVGSQRTGLFFSWYHH
jgi:hypothetical protein